MFSTWWLAVRFSLTTLFCESDDFAASRVHRSDWFMACLFWTWCWIGYFGLGRPDFNSTVRGIFRWTVFHCRPVHRRLLCQLGEFSAAGEAVDSEGSPQMLLALRDRLLQSYPSDHPVLILYSSVRPDYRSLGRRVLLSHLAEQPVPVYSNLWVPSLNGLALEKELVSSTMDGRGT